MRNTYVLIALALLLVSGCYTKASFVAGTPARPWPERVTNAKCSADGRTVALWSAPFLVIRNAEVGTETFRVKCMEMENVVLTVSDDGKKVIGFDADQKDVRLWDIEKETQIPFAFKNRDVLRYSFSVDGREIIAKTKDGLEVFSAETGKFVRKVEED